MKQKSKYCPPATSSLFKIRHAKHNPGTEPAVVPRNIVERQDFCYNGSIST